VYSQFYLPIAGRLTQERNNLIATIEDCVIKDQCSYKTPSDLAILFLEDVISVRSLNMECGYSRYSFTDVSGQARTTDVLTNISVNLRGDVRLAEFVSVKNALLNRFGPDTQAIQLSPGFSAVSMSEVDANGNARITATLDYRAIQPEVVQAAGTVSVSNISAISKLRETIQGSVYMLSFQAKNGLSILNTVGPPFGGDCPSLRNGV
jgi:hypothetical protein